MSACASCILHAGYFVHAMQKKKLFRFVTFSKIAVSSIRDSPHGNCTIFQVNAVSRYISLRMKKKRKKNKQEKIIKHETRNCFFDQILTIWRPADAFTTFDWTCAFVETVTTAHFAHLSPSYFLLFFEPLAKERNKNVGNNLSWAVCQKEAVLLMSIAMLLSPGVAVCTNRQPARLDASIRSAICASSIISFSIFF